MRSYGLRKAATRFLRMAALAKASGDLDFAAYCFEKAEGMMAAWAKHVRGNFRSPNEC